MKLKLELKNVKIWGGHDGPVFQASLYMDGKKSFTVSNCGHGGPNDFADYKEEDMKKLDDYCASLPPEETSMKNKDGSPWMYQMDSEGLVDHLLQEWEDKKELKKSLKKGTLIHQIKDGKDAIISYKIKWEDRLKKYRFNGEVKTFEQHISHKDTVLNLLPFDDALILYKKGVN